MTFETTLISEPRRNLTRVPKDKKHKKGNVSQIKCFDKAKYKTTTFNNWGLPPKVILKGG